MTTVRQLERLWNDKAYSRILSNLLEMRQEDCAQLRDELGKAIPAAAYIIIRLDELGQSHQPLVSRLIREVLAAQESDGGWGDVLPTALCCRALLCSAGHGQALSRGLKWLAALQKDDGLWPRVPLRRMPGDPFVTAFVLFQLSPSPAFQQAARVDPPLNWLDDHGDELDADTLRLCNALAARRPGRAIVWS